jgi:hypothetical protein
MVAKRLDRLRNIDRGDEEYLTFKEWFTADTWLNDTIHGSWRCWEVDEKKGQSGKGTVTHLHSHLHQDELHASWRHLVKMTFHSEPWQSENPYPRLLQLYASTEHDYGAVDATTTYPCWKIRPIFLCFAFLPYAS